jgi:hypothetical protein
LLQDLATVSFSGNTENISRSSRKTLLQGRETRTGQRFCGYVVWIGTSLADITILQIFHSIAVRERAKIRPASVGG